jgi:hypothetical protein
VADIRRLEAYVKARGHNDPDLGRDYGELSELAHPTRSAAENSAAISLWRLGLNEDGHTIEQAIENLDRSIPSMLYRLLWLAFDEHGELVPLQLDMQRAPTADALCKEFQKKQN